MTARSPTEYRLLKSHTTNHRRNLGDTRLQLAGSCFVHVYIVVEGVRDNSIRADMPETTPETCAPAKESPFFIKNLLNCDSKPSKPKPMFAAAKAGLEGGLSLSQVGDLHFPRFDFPTQRFALPAYLERASAWWYPYTISPSSHFQRSTEGMYTRLLCMT